MSYNFPDSPFVGQAFTPPGGPTWEFGEGAWKQAMPLSPPVAGASFLDVRMYGATGDGVTDDYLAIQAAMDAAENRMLFFPRGDYYITRGCAIADGCTVFGEGYGSRIIMPESGFTLAGDTSNHGMFLVRGTPDHILTGVRITGLHFYGSKTVEYARAAKLIYYECVNGFMIDHCWLMHHAFECIWAGGFNSIYNDNVIISNNYSKDCGHPAGAYVGLPVIQPNGRNSTVIGNVIEDCGTGIGPTGFNIVVANNRIKGVKVVGIGLGDGTQTSNCTIIGNAIELEDPSIGARSGINLGDGAPPYGREGVINVIGNSIRVHGNINGAARGIWSNTSRHTNIADNVIEVEKRGTGIQVSGTAPGSRVTVRGNTIWGTGEIASIYGIVATPETSGNTLTIHSMNNYVYGITIGMGSYAYDFRNLAGGTLIATSTNDIMEGGSYRMGDIIYGAGQLDGIPINARMDRTRPDSFDQIAGVGMLNFGAGRFNAISGGVLAMARTDASFMHKQTRVLAEAESSAATDDLDTISGTNAGDFLILSPAHDGHTVVAKDNTGNLRLAGDFAMDSITDTLMLISDGTNLYELSRSDNGT